MEEIIKKIAIRITLTFIMLNYGPVMTYDPFIAYSQTKDQCTEQLMHAEKEYRSGNLDKAMKLVLECLAKSDISERDKEEARRLKGLVFVASNLELEAKVAVKNLLLEVPEYKFENREDTIDNKNAAEIKTSVISPIVFNLSPSRIEEGASGFILRVKGMNFSQSAKVRFNGIPKMTTFIDSTELIAEIKSEDIKEAGFFNVIVINEAKEFSRSNDMSFEVTASKFPWLLVGSVTGAIVAGITVILLLR